MKPQPPYHHLGHYFEIPPRWRWVLWPAVATSGGGTALLLWLQEGPLLLAECAPLVALPGMAALFYWFDRLIFKATKPSQEDLLDKSPTRDKQS